MTVCLSWFLRFASTLVFFFGCKVSLAWFRPFCSWLPSFPKQMFSFEILFPAMLVFLWFSRVMEFRDSFGVAAVVTQSVQLSCDSILVEPKEKNVSYYCFQNIRNSLG